jgi:hypothetical protein
MITYNCEEIVKEVWKIRGKREKLLQEVTLPKKQ